MPRFDAPFEQFQRRVPLGRWQIVTVEFATAGADTIVPHSLATPDPEQVDYEVIRVNGPGFIHHDGTEGRRSWGEGFIVLRSTSAPLVADIRLSVAAEPLRSRTIPQGVTVNTESTLDTLGGQPPSYYRNASNINAGVLAPTFGGTGHNAYAKGDLLVARTATALDRLTVGAATSLLTADPTATAGVTWAAWGPLFRLTDPPTTGWSWVNQGGATVDGLYLEAPASATDSLRLRVRTLPTAPYTITAALLIGAPDVTGLSAGLCWRDSASGKVITAAWTPTAIEAVKYTSPTALSAAYSGTWPRTGALVWLQISDSGTTRAVKTSTDGAHWQTVVTSSNTDFCTPDQVGCFANSTSSSYPCAMTLLSWKEA